MGLRTQGSKDGAESGSAHKQLIDQRSGRRQGLGPKALGELCAQEAPTWQPWLSWCLGHCGWLRKWQMLKTAWEER